MGGLCGVIGRPQTSFFALVVINVLCTGNLFTFTRSTLFEGESSRGVASRLPQLAFTRYSGPKGAAHPGRGIDRADLGGFQAALCMTRVVAGTEPSSPIFRSPSAYGTQIWVCNSS